MSTAANEIRRGELYWLDWSPGRGSEQAGRRPALIVAADASNSNPRYPLTIVAAVSTTVREILSHVPLEPSPENGLRTRSSVKCEQVMTVEKERLVARIGRVTEQDMHLVDAALKRSLGLR